MSIFKESWAYELSLILFFSILFLLKHFSARMDAPWQKWLSSIIISFIGAFFTWKSGALYNQASLVFFVSQIFLIASLGWRLQLIASSGFYLFIGLPVLVDAYAGVLSNLPENWVLFHDERRTGNAVLITYIVEILLVLSFIYWKKQVAEETDDDEVYVRPETTALPIINDSEPEKSDAFHREEEKATADLSLKNVPLEKLLESVVYFMHRNFQCQTAMAFISQDGGHSFKINAYKSISEKDMFLEKDLTVNNGGSGVIAKAIQVGGFSSGNISQQNISIEYYKNKGHANSIIVQKVMDENGRHCVGLLAIDHANINQFNDEHRDGVQRFSAIASKLISQVRLSHELIKHMAKNEMVYEITSLLNQQLHVTDVLKAVIANFNKVFNCDRLVFCDYNPDIGKARLMKVIGAEAGIKEGEIFEINNNKSFYGSVFRESKEGLCNFFSEEHYRFNDAQTDKGFVHSAIAAPILDENGGCIGVVGIESRIPGALERNDLIVLKTLTLSAASALAKAKAFTKMEKQATTDGLTGIPNHRTFQDYLDKEMAKSERRQRKISLLLMDIDHFKNFNDTYGHPIGDKVLKMVANTIRKSIRTTDLVARYGGEEFVVVLDEANIEDARLSAERIRQNIENTVIPHEDKTLKVTVSIGCAIFPLDGATKAELIDNSDKAMYHSKEAGRNRVTMYCEMNKE